MPVVLLLLNSDEFNQKLPVKRLPSSGAEEQHAIPGLQGVSQSFTLTFAASYMNCNF